MTGNSNDETNFHHKLLLTNRQVASLPKTFANDLPTNIKLSKTQLSKKIQSGGFLGRLLGPLLKTGLSLMENVIKKITKSVLIPLQLTAAAAAADARIHKNVLGSGKSPLDLAKHTTTTLTMSNDEIPDIIKIVKSLEDSGLLLKGVRETIREREQEGARKKKGGFLSILLGTIGASLLGNIFAGKGMNRPAEGFFSVASSFK